VIRLLAAYGADLNQPTGRNHLGVTTNATPLHLAALYGNMCALTALLECGADTTRRNSSGRTALMFGCNSTNNYVATAKVRSRLCSVLV
jgi:ankyrin repeat protein